MRIRMSSGFLFTMILVSVSLSSATIYDGGEFSPSKVEPHTDLGSEGPDPGPGNLAIEEDRHSAAPVGRAFYVLGEDQKCHWGNFAYSKYEKALIVYNKSTLSLDHCIYQKSSDAHAQGFTVSAREGGVCVPTKGILSNGDGKIVGIRESGNPTVISNCLDHTVSYTDILDKDRIKSEEERLPARAMEKSFSPYTASVTAGPDPVVGVPAASLLNEKSVQDEATNEPKHEPKHEIEKAPETEAVKMPTGDAKPRNPTSLDKEISKPAGNFTIQISSVTSAEDAQREIDKLREKGIEAFQVEADVKGTKRYRICTGHFQSRAEAKEARSSVVRKSGVSGAFIQTEK